MTPALPLIEPLGLLHGSEAADAVAAGRALPLAGGPAAFALARLIDESGARVVAAPDIPASWQARLAPLLRSAPPAGLPPGALVMGILNATPDSFSDGGRHLAAADAIAAGRAMAAAGAALLDIGGESTRPGAVPVPPDEEQRRILPVLAGLRGAGPLLSVDTRHAATMACALAAGAAIVNDVSALRHDPDAAPLLAAHGCAVVLMHMRGTPATMRDLVGYDDVAVAVTRDLAARVEAAERAGIARGRLLVDPGIGFAKTAAQSFALIRRLPLLLNLGCRVVLGVSRKRFIGAASGVERASDRLPGSLAAGLAGLAVPDLVLRVHDVPETVQAVRVWQALHG